MVHSMAGSVVGSSATSIVPQENYKRPLCGPFPLCRPRRNDLHSDIIVVVWNQRLSSGDTKWSHFTVTK